MSRGRALAGPVVVLLGGLIMAVAPVIPYLLERDNLFLEVREEVFWSDLEVNLTPAIPGVIVTLLAVCAMVWSGWRGWRWIFTFVAILAVVGAVAAYVAAQDFTHRPQKYDAIMDFVVTFAIGALVVSAGTVLEWRSGAVVDASPHRAPAAA